MSNINRRQSGRAVRSTASRPSNYYAGQFSQIQQTEQPTPEHQPGFYPAITHFTDAIDALPREVMRHFSMAKEVAAKLYGPEEEIERLAAQMVSDRRARLNDSGGDAMSQDETNVARELGYRIAMLAPMLEEKILVLSTASLSLQRQLEVLESSYKHIPEEISEEARLGSTTHWAYVAEKEPKKTGNERTRREAAAANSYAGGVARIHDLDEVAGRSEARREAVTARKIRNQQLDSDFEDKPTSRKQHSKKKQVEQAQMSSVAPGMGPINGVAGPNKRKKPAGAVMERSLSGVLSNQKGSMGSPTLGAESGKKRKNAPGPLPGRKRLQQSAPRSPHAFASSPLLGSFSIKETGNKGAHARGRHGSQSSVIQPIALDNSRTIPMSPRVSIAKNGLPPVVEPSPVTELPPATLPNVDIPQAEANGTTTVLTLDTALSLKQEPGEVGEEVEVPDAEEMNSTVVTTRTGRVSKTATPMATTFPETAQPTKSRGNGNGSHASSESGNAQSERMSTRDKRRRGDKEAEEARKLAFAEELASENGEEADVEDDEEEENEPRYCYCNEVSYGFMVACDNDDCARQWFHMRCTGLEKPPASTTKWYCDECKLLQKDSRRSRPSSSRQGVA